LVASPLDRDMEKVDIDALDRWEHPMPDTPGPHRIGDALGATDVAINYYDLAPGEGLSGGPHTHMDQEEIFVVLSGHVAFEVGEADEAVPIGEGGSIRFAPGEVQHGYNDGDGPAEVLAIGAPADSEDVRSPGACPACGAEVLLEVEVPEDGGGLRVTCPECGETTDV
jgi:uncharacterized cupin superfamily protein